MDLVDKIRGVAYLGAGNVAASVRFGARRSWRELRGRARSLDVPLSPPGPWTNLQMVRFGAKLEFARATVTIELLRTDVARVTWEPGRLPAPYLVLEQDWGPVEMHIEVASDQGIEHPPEQGSGGLCVRKFDDDTRLRLETADLDIRVSAEGDIRFFAPGGRLLRHDLPPLSWSDQWVHRAKLEPEEHCYGLGERNFPFNVRGARARMWNTEPKGSYKPDQDPIYVCIPAFFGVHDRGSYLIFFENTHDGTVSLEDLATTRFSGGALRYYVIPGPPSRAIPRLAQLTGLPNMPPRWSLGFHQARWSYMNEGEVRALLESFEAWDLPLSAVHLDIHYMDRYRVFTVDRKRFPDLAGLARDLDAHDVKLVAILDPGVKMDPGCDVYRSGVKADVFCKYPDGSPVTAPVWPGDCCFPDFTNPAAREWWGEHYRMFVEAGVAGIWHDMNEPAAFTPWGEPTLPSDTRHDLEGRGGDHTEAHNVYATLEARAGYEALRRLDPDRRPWILSRSGGAGLQRYAWTWTGDCESSWDGLRLTLVHALGLSICGIPYTGSDIGGFGGTPTTELFIRWFQACTFLPFFRAHSAFFTPPREPWAFGEPALSIVREHLALRTRLMPYLYTLAWEASRAGTPLVRPLFWNHPDVPALWDVEDAFLLGDALLVAPITGPGILQRELELPPGTWYPLSRDMRLEGPPQTGPRRVPLEAPLERVPFLARGGTVLPVQEGDRIVLHLFLPVDGDGDGRSSDRTGGLEGASHAGSLYRDAGDGYGDWLLERFSLKQSEAGWVLTRSCEGDFAAPTELVLEVHGGHLDGEDWEGVRVDGVARALDAGRVVVAGFGTVLVPLGASR